MELIESLRIAMRQRILVKSQIVPAAQFQMEGKDAPQNADLYIREAIFQSDVTELTQNFMRYQFLCEYDAFVNRAALPGVTGQLYRLGGQLRQEFPPGADIALDGWDNVQCFVASPLEYGNVTQEGDIFELPVMINVDAIVPRSAVYNGD